MIVLALAAALVFLALAPRILAVTAPAQPLVVNFDVPVDPGSSGMMAGVLDQARADRSSAIVIEMNTPGGLLSDMTDIITTIEQANQSGIPTYTYVPPNGLAASAGSYIAMASNSIIMGPGSEIGPSTPIVVGGTALEQNHTEGAMISLMVSLADKWGRNSTAAYEMVYSDTAYSASQAYALHIADGNASSLQDALSQWGLSSSYTTVQEGTYDQLLSALSNENVAGLLILLGGLAIVLDFFHPTLVLSVAGAIAIVAGLVGAEAVGASALGLVVIAVGVGLMLLELQLGHGLAMVSGAIVGGAGVYLLFLGVGVSSNSADLTQVEAVGVAGIGVMAALYIRWVIGPLRTRKKLTGPESLPGKVGVAATALNPTGEVRLEGITWRATSLSGEISQGERVRVKSEEKLVLLVERESIPPAATDGRS
jgi:membrane-bound serine protease (ClpP class)